jgi:hypothetical protein
MDKIQWQQFFDAVSKNDDVQSQVCQYTAELIEKLTDGDAFVFPENASYTFTDWSNDLRLLEVSLPGTFSTSFQSN